MRFPSPPLVIHFEIKIKHFVMEVLHKLRSRENTMNAHDSWNKSSQQACGEFRVQPRQPGLEAYTSRLSRVYGWGLSGWDLVTDRIWGPSREWTLNKERRDYSLTFKKMYVFIEFSCWFLYFSCPERVFSIFNNFIFQEARSWNFSSWPQTSGSGLNWKMCSKLWLIQ